MLLHRAGLRPLLLPLNLQPRRSTREQLLEVAAHRRWLERAVLLSRGAPDVPQSPLVIQRDGLPQSRSAGPPHTTATRSRRRTRPILGQRLPTHQQPLQRRDFLGEILGVTSLRTTLLARSCKGAAVGRARFRAVATGCADLCTRVCLTLDATTTASAGEGALARCSALDGPK